MQWSKETFAIGEAVTRLPCALAESGSVSAYALLADSGYPERHAEITPDVVQAVLSDDPELVNVWLQYSENKRTPSGWYFFRAPASYIVGYLLVGGRRVDEFAYVDAIEACANFIKQEIEEMRQVCERRPRAKRPNKGSN